MTEKLIILTRYPEPGRAKTRLIPALGAQGAADLQRSMTAETIAQGVLLSERRPGLSLEVRFDGGRTELMRSTFGEARYVEQGDGDLGARIARAFEHAFASGSQRVIVIGADCPDVDADLLADALDRLSNCDVVIGPATDGGYYLIGLRRPEPRLFRGVDWGTERVFRQTLAIADALGLEVDQLSPLSDIDEPKDLERCTGALLNGRAGLAAVPSKHSRISVIIPAYNEEARIGTTLSRIASTTVAEVIVVDGGSTDDTVRVAEEHGATVLVSAPGRSNQMNAGARIAIGEYLLFLHADTLLPNDFGDAVCEMMRDESVIAGAFRFRLDAPGMAYRVLERAVDLRSRRFGMPYGDQAIFLRRRTFESLGGFPSMPVMEDFEFVRRLKARGRIGICAQAVMTSARRWQSRGFIRTTLRHQAAIIGYLLGVSPQSIARLLRGAR